MDQDNRHQRFSVWLMVCFLLVGAGLFLRQQAETSRSMFQVSSIWGNRAPAFELVDLADEPVTLAGLKDKVVLINFWGTTCAPCLHEIPWLVEFQELYGPEGFQVVAISMYGEGPEVLTPFIEQHGMEDFRVVIGTPQTGDLFGGVFALPTTFIVDRQGKYHSKHEGLINRADVESAIVALLNRPL